MEILDGGLMNSIGLVNQFLDTISDLHELGFALANPNSSQLDIATIFTPAERKARIEESIKLYGNLIDSYPQYDHSPSGILDMLAVLMVNSEKTSFHLDKDIYDMFWEDRNELAHKFNYNICEKQRIYSK